MALGEGRGVAVMATAGTPGVASDDDFRILGQGEGEGGLPSSFVYALEEDLDGEVWVGTLQGPAVFYQPSGLFGTDPIDAQQILIEQDGNFQFLLETETVWDIALDGGNRKWLATVNSGVFLLSPMAGSRWRTSRRKTAPCRPMRSTMWPSTKPVAWSISPRPMGSRVSGDRHQFRLRTRPDLPDHLPQSMAP